MKGYPLKISSSAITLIKKQQGLSLEKYCDNKGLWVIGYGHVIREWEHFPKLITPLQAEYLLFDDLELCETLLRENGTRPLTPQQHDTVVMLIFGAGDISSLSHEILQAITRV
ncbi:glycoside hydrolase family protein [Enterobacter wuhouensis]|jgi:GH24 family phage-related lysozyme (muramidase)|uniref:Lysozyme n=1 Tax=Enterobacter wuhouensis TaxID=2529381 RepID=A0A4R0G258_9ENTR|nr:lysozyme [Enterobacter wuhouensis]MCV2534492.1 lysozyme [Enterobacter wuhouensis]TCB90654.1 lysozyme [Enterobacter wuhouensis]WRW31323.1 lysozyme [Enterobacter wuhouensis]